MSVQLRGEVLPVIPVTQCNYTSAPAPVPCVRGGGGLLLCRHQVFFGQHFDSDQWEDYRLEDELWREQCRREEEN